MIIKRAPTVQVTFPPNRPPKDDSTHKGLCGGTEAGKRVDYPLTGGKISVTQSAAIDNLNFLWTKETSGDYTFKTYGEPTVVDISSGSYCANGPDFSSLGFKTGDEATILVMYQADGPPRRGTDKRWQHLCADVRLVDASNFNGPSGLDCQSQADEMRVAKPDEIMNLTLNSDGSGGRNPNALAAMQPKFTTTEAGGIGAGVTAGVFLLALAALYFTGLLRFGRKSRSIRRSHDIDDASSTASFTKQVQH